MELSLLRKGVANAYRILEAGGLVLSFMQEVRVALLGFGNVARAFCRHLLSVGGPAVRISAVADRSGGVLLDDAIGLEELLAGKEAGHSLEVIAARRVTRSISDFVAGLPAAGVQVLLESLPTNLTDGQPGLDLLKTALSAHIHVVTVDKGPLVHGFGKLRDMAVRSGVRLEFTGALGVRPPEEISGCQLLEIQGILNGTSNFILTEMQERGATFKEALDHARREGIAEPESYLDIEGWDTACKILILANAFMGDSPLLSDISRIGLGPETENLVRTGRRTGRALRLIGRARIWKGGVRVSVAPKLVNSNSPFFSVAGTSKLALFRTREKGELRGSARSGRNAIAQTILDDIRRITLQAAPFME